MNSAPKATFQYDGDNLDDVLKFLKRARSELRELRMVRVWKDRVEVIDVNTDVFLVEGLGYPDADVIAVLDAVNTVYKKKTIHEPVDDDFKQFKTGRRYPWAADRVM